MPNYEPFSVLMSVYSKDRADWVRQALDSVLCNTEQPTELVIMVDGPVGKELQTVLGQFGKNPLVRIINHQTNIGRGAALAIAVPQCENELIALVDADDICRTNRFEKQLSAFAADRDLMVVGGQVQELKAEDLTPLNTCRYVPLTDTQIRQYLKTRMPLNNTTVMFKKNTVLDSGNFQDFWLMEDYYMWARVAAKGYKMGNVPDILVDVRVDSSLYGRRGGWKYFKSNFAMSKKLRALGLINWPTHAFNTVVRFCVQVLMPNRVRGWFYRIVLR